MSAPIPQLLAHCPLCHAAYDRASIRLLGDLPAMRADQGKPQLFHLTCKQCRHALLAAISESAHGVSSVGLVTDLEVQDAVRIHPTAPISADDVVRAHQDLEQDSKTLCRAWEAQRTAETTRG